jgi:hypothetical protein
MPWLSRAVPATPVVNAAADGGTARVRWQSADGGVAKWAVQARYGSRWAMARVVSGAAGGVDLGGNHGSLPDAVAVSAIDRFGNASAPAVLRR